MKLGKIAGQVVSTARIHNLPRYSLLVVEVMRPTGEPTGETLVAMDSLGAGEGEWVLLTCGSAARLALPDNPPVDAAIVGIIDQVGSLEKTFYKKHQ